MTEWRVIVTSQNQGIQVLDVEADSEADAKGKAHTAAHDHLSARGITSVTAVPKQNMPASFYKRVTGEA